MPALPRPLRLSLHEAVSYVSERCKCDTQKAGGAVLAGLKEGELVASANALASDRSYMPGIIVGALRQGPPRRVDAGIETVPANLWVGCPWWEFLRRSVLPRGRPMYREQTADGRQVGPVYSNPTIATADIDAWLGADGGSYKVSADATEEEKGLISELYETSEMKVGAFGFKIDLKPIVERVRRYLHLR